jgi:hypothetical protein
LAHKLSGSGTYGNNRRIILNYKIELPVSSADPDDIKQKTNEIQGRFTFKYTIEIE